MIAHLRGNIAEVSLDKDTLRIVIDVGGVGYDVFMAKSNEFQIRAGQSIKVLIEESVTAFDGATKLYGFVSSEERDIFRRIREKVDGMGPKKALECLDKINKSVPDFRRALIDNDQRLLVSVFGFTKKTAEKLFLAFKGQADSWVIQGKPKWVESPTSSVEMEALSGLVNLGYPEEDARRAVQDAKKKMGEKATTELILQDALQRIGKNLAGKI